LSNVDHLQNDNRSNHSTPCNSVMRVTVMEYNTVVGVHSILGQFCITDYLFLFCKKPTWKIQETSIVSSEVYQGRYECAQALSIHDPLRLL
jgi:hypothetical protein